MANKGQVFSGARAIFSIGGIQVGYARNVSGGEEITQDPVEVLGNIEVEEFVETAYRASLRMGQFRIIGQTIKSLGWFPKVGKSTDEHLNNILTSGDLVCTVEDRKPQTDGSKAIMATFQQCKIASHNWTIDARGIVGEDVDFVTIRLLDETEV